MNNGHYFNNCGEPKVFPSYCIFLDILGFKDKIIDAKSKNESNKLLNHLYTTLNNAYLNLQNNNRSWYTKTFSDNILLAHPINDDDETIFGSIIDSVQEFQLEMILAGYLIRGGWAIGELFIDKEFVYGSALVDAVKCEKEAKFPRVLLSDEMKSLVKKHLEYYNLESHLAPQQRDVLKDEQDNYFLNYLQPVLIDVDTHDIKTLELHKDHIIAGFKSMNDPEILAKYEWLADYHDYFLINSIQDQNDLLLNIPGKHKFSIIP